MFVITHENNTILLFKLLAFKASRILYVANTNNVGYKKNINCKFLMFGNILDNNSCFARSLREIDQPIPLCLPNSIHSRWELSLVSKQISYLSMCVKTF